MSRRSALLLTAALIAVGLASLGYLWSKRGAAPKKPAESVALEPGEAPPAGQAAIYFPAVSGKLEAETRPIPAELGPEDLELWIAEQLVAGPETEGLLPALPPETQVAGVYTAEDRTVFVDFTLVETVGMGSTEEILALYSIVNTLVLADERAERVVILINGRQRDTLAGHVDTSVPLAARPDLIRKPG